MKFPAQIKNLPADSRFKLVVAQRALNFMKQSGSGDNNIVYIIDKDADTLRDVQCHKHAMVPKNCTLVILNCNFVFLARTDCLSQITEYEPDYAALREARNKQHERQMEESRIKAQGQPCPCSTCIIN